MTFLGRSSVAAAVPAADVLFFGHPNIGPILRTPYQPGPYRILQNIIALLINAFLVPQAMIKEIGLPDDAMLSRQPMFPKTDDFCHGLVRRNAQQEMNVIRHEEGKIAKPATFQVIMVNGREDVLADVGMAKLIYAA
jgi:hypothetical protein